MTRFLKPTKICIAKPITKSRNYGHLEGILRTDPNKQQLNSQLLRNFPEFPFNSVISNSN